MNSNLIKIVCIEDDAYFSQLIQRGLQAYLRPVAEDRGFTYEVRSYTDPMDFIRNLEPDTDIILTDYYLGGGITGALLLKKIRRLCPDCYVILVSSTRDEGIIGRVLEKGADEFIPKNRHVLDRVNLVVEAMVENRLSA